MKKRKFSMRRHMMQTADAQRRWDQAYQCLVRWSAATLREAIPAGIRQEKRHESRDVCARLYAAASPNADH